MKFIFIAIFYLGGVTVANGQFKEINVSQADKLWVGELKCLDSNGIITSLCSLGLDGICIEFYKAFINLEEREIRLIGRCDAIGGIDIFEAIKVENRLINKRLISETSIDNKYINNDGFFDITMKVDKMESLFFHERLYFLRELRIYELFKS